LRAFPIWLNQEKRSKYLFFIALSDEKPLRTFTGNAFIWDQTKIQNVSLQQNFLLESG